jgi:hypothetical protein
MALLYRIPGMPRFAPSAAEPWTSEDLEKTPAGATAATGEPTPAKDGAPRPVEANVFSRTITTPPGAPWDQDRAAELEARMGAPLPLDHIVYRRRRLEPWRPGRHGRFAIFYARTVDVAGGLDAAVSVDGRPVRVRFQAPGENLARVRRLAPALIVGVASSLFVAGAITAAFGVRASTEDRLAQLEQLAQTRLRQAELAQRLKVQSRLLKERVPRRSTVADYLNDIGWASSAKAPDAHIDAVYWRNGYMGVAVRGEAAAPFSAQGRAIAKAVKPVRPGVWLWLVAPPGRALPVMDALQSNPPASSPGP